MSTKKKTEKTTAKKTPKALDAKMIAKFQGLSNFLKVGRTAEQIAKSYKLASVVSAKRLVAGAVAAGFKITTSKSEKKADHVGRRPNVYAFAG